MTLEVYAHLTPNAAAGNADDWDVLYGAGGSAKICPCRDGALARDVHDAAADTFGLTDADRAEKLPQDLFGS
jgi:hypothetical protein